MKTCLDESEAKMYEVEKPSGKEHGYGQITHHG